MKKNLSVGEVAERCNIKVSTVHHYENKGLIHGWRNSGNQRRFSRDVLRRISIIKAAQKVGIKLDDIKASFSHLPKKQTPDESDWQRLSMVWKKDLNEKIDYLTKLRDNLSSCIGCGCLSLDRCPLYNKDDKFGKIAKGADIFYRK
ncbi:MULTISPECIES: redox-sensitive transcriptional activator SoxR [Francisella]|uniref:Redox-sensitive transcriptional activator SoxR n=1 Tax=Francisella adeliensis TaxID=2007306 RepID=A0A2Z4Y1X6_9GAMM|nr:MULTISPECIES: redox-sensitive transcriptional activator SoxR [Francisella]MCL4110924.1 hypothetical protein [Idotea baltica]AXA34515.1 redox-sensitive transcriptional activator SoxR [Francisella adeliensis]MBK2086236.1 redox-sensitive transcriptional activator SoxR [Francisella adeliensis]MBK2096453.1 redox-sensitive transcriptional activator SoxR [Francisella adeliensis]QIW12762.1 redox-sensitive transcriptional activator SoxR [Francisella adeliensis]